MAQNVIYLADRVHTFNNKITNADMVLFYDMDYFLFKEIFHNFFFDESRHFIFDSASRRGRLLRWCAHMRGGSAVA